MQFKNGYLGVMVVVLAIVSTALGAWVLSLDVEEREVTRYDYVTELTGLFDSEQAPTYIQYNPSVNMTGYYTDASTKYFDGVDATLTSQRSQYRVDAAPISETAPTDMDLSTQTSDTDTMRFWYWPTTDNNRTSYNANVQHLTFTALLTNLGISTYDRITIKSPQGSDTGGGFVAFVPDSFVRLNGFGQKVVYMKNPALTETLIIDEPMIPAELDPKIDASNAANPIRAASYDSSTGYTTLYYDSEMTESAGLFTANNIYVVWENSGFLGHTLNYSGADYPDDIYMQIKNGVKIDG